MSKTRKECQLSIVIVSGCIVALVALVTHIVELHTFAADFYSTNESPWNSLLDFGSRYQLDGAKISGWLD